MPVTPTQRKRFGDRLSQLRDARGLTSDEAVAELLATENVVKTGATIEGWRKGRWAPRSRDEVEALERVLGAEGELLPLLGYDLGPTTGERMNAIEQRQAAQEAELRELREVLGQIQAQIPALARQPRARR